METSPEPPSTSPRKVISSDQLEYLDPEDSERECLFDRDSWWERYNKSYEERHEDDSESETMPKTFEYFFKLPVEIQRQILQYICVFQFGVYVGDDDEWDVSNTVSTTVIEFDKHGDPYLSVDSARPPVDLFLASRALYTLASGDAWVGDEPAVLLSRDWGLLVPQDKAVSGEYEKVFTQKTSALAARRRMRSVIIYLPNSFEDSLWIRGMLVPVLKDMMEAGSLRQLEVRVDDRFAIEDVSEYLGEHRESLQELEQPALSMFRRLQELEQQEEAQRGAESLQQRLQELEMERQSEDWSRQVKDVHQALQQELQRAEQHLQRLQQLHQSQQQQLQQWLQTAQSQTHFLTLEARDYLNDLEKEGRRDLRRGIYNHPLLKLLQKEAKNDELGEPLSGKRPVRLSVSPRHIAYWCKYHAGPKCDLDKLYEGYPNDEVGQDEWVELDTDKILKDFTG
ncbi:hypothetical protein QBC46DRAFT_338361 [Diplogelasinospora grovesii]|uniref:Uncharacterized protein n=1 Tax=Diplogelasinospora grovesii TaxID=303347 RepID=A0AAN6NEM9_9PEZI|nr:hypothetical protein QBC46DRAFT_338361 [Diplogelasinospora grovesii]